MKTQPNDAAFATGDEYWRQNGLTKREYFAAMAMQGIVSNHLMIDTTNWNWLSEESVKAADALITALNENQ
jgi:hypothetical protein